MIENFWTWITRSVSNALNTLNYIVTNPTTGPFMELLLVVFLVIILIRYIILPLIGDYFSGKSDKAKKKKGAEE